MCNILFPKKRFLISFYSRQVCVQSSGGVSATIIIVIPGIVICCMDSDEKVETSELSTCERHCESFFFLFLTDGGEKRGEKHCRRDFILHCCWKTWRQHSLVWMSEHNRKEQERSQSIAAGGHLSFSLAIRIRFHAKLWRMCLSVILCRKDRRCKKGQRIRQELWLTTSPLESHMTSENRCLDAGWVCDWIRISKKALDSLSSVSQNCTSIHHSESQFAERKGKLNSIRTEWHERLLEFVFSIFASSRLSKISFCETSLFLRTEGRIIAIDPVPSSLAAN